MLFEAQKGNFTLAATGDIIATRRLNVLKEEGFLKIREVLQSADCAYANLESPVHGHQFAPYAKIAHGSNHPETVEDLKWLGLGIVAFANNHTCDWGTDGMFYTLQLLDEAQIRYAGAGQHLQDAIAPGFLDTSRGRVALISATSTFEPGWRAGEQRPDFQGRPGANCLGFSTTYTVDKQAFDEVRRISQKLGHEAQKERQRAMPYAAGGPDSETRFRLYDKVFELGDKWRANTKCNPRDLENNLKWIRSAAKQADWVLVALHSHVEGDTPDVPADFEIEFAHACLDAGAHVFLGSGPHHCWPVEIYNGKPIFYSLGNFVMQLETFARQAQEAYDAFNLGREATTADWWPGWSGGEKGASEADPKFWRAVFTTVDWEDRKLKEIKLYPIDLGQHLHWPQRARPVLADAKVGKEILEKVQQLSQPFGTKIEVKDGVGIIRV